MKELDWDERGRVARTALEPLLFCAGAWEGEGESYGNPLTGRLSVELRFGGTFLEAREALYTPAGEVDHEDACWYRYDIRLQQLKVTQMMAHAWQAEQLVMPLDDGPGFRWYSGPFSPRVEVRPQGADGLVIEVWEPFQERASHRMVYRRVGG